MISKLPQQLYSHICIFIVTINLRYFYSFLALNTWHYQYLYLIHGILMKILKFQKESTLKSFYMYLRNKIQFFSLNFYQTNTIRVFKIVHKLLTKCLVKIFKLIKLQVRVRAQSKSNLTIIVQQFNILLLQMLMGNLNLKSFKTSLNYLIV